MKLSENMEDLVKLTFYIKVETLRSANHKINSVLYSFFIYFHEILLVIIKWANVEDKSGNL